MDKTPWIIERFDRARHARADFDCGNAALNAYLFTKISQFGKKGLAQTYVLAGQGQAVIKGYYALSNHTVLYNALPKDQTKGLPQEIDIPVVLLGRLAVDRSVQGRRLGELLLIDALRRSDYLSEKIGIRAVEVHAIDGPARRFYKKYGFLTLKDDPHHLFLPMHVIRKLKLPPL